MTYMDEIFSRADIQQIREFLLHGVEEPHIDSRPYSERTECALKRVTAQLHEAYPEQEEYERVANLVYDCVGAFEAGAIVAAQVCQNLKTAFEEE